MGHPVWLGIDLGTTVLKVCAFDGHSGAMLAQDSRRLKLQDLPGGGKEMDLGVLDRTFQSVLRKVRSQLQSKWDRIEGIGLASQAGSTIIAHRKTGQALIPMILWNDGRDHHRTLQLNEQNPSRYWRKYLLNDSAPAGLGRMQRLKETQSELFHPDHIHIGAGEYLYFRLTGAWRQDAGNALQIGSYNAAANRLFPTLLKKVGVPLSFVAPLYDQTKTNALSREGARLTALQEGIPVAGPYFDQEASYVSATGACRFPLQVSLGTAWVGNFSLPEHLKGESPTQLVVGAPLHKGKLVVQPLLSGNPTWEWGLRTFVHPKIAHALTKAQEIFSTSLFPENSLHALPWLSAGNPLATDSRGAGGFWGVSDQTTKEDMLRALMNGMCFELARMFQDVKDHDVIDGVVLGGGASKADYFRTIIAALFSPRPVYRQMDEDLSTARGSIHFFDAKAGQAKIKKISPPNCKIIQQTQKRYLEYRNIFETVLGKVSTGKAYRITRSKA